MQEIKPRRTGKVMPFLSNGQDLKLTVFNSGGPKTSISVCQGGAWAVSEPLWGCQGLRAGDSLGRDGGGDGCSWWSLVSVLVLPLGCSSWDQSWGSQGPAELWLPGTHTQPPWNGSGMPREGLCRDLAGSVVPDHWGTQAQHHYW